MADDLTITRKIILIKMFKESQIYLKLIKQIKNDTNQQ